MSQFTQFCSIFCSCGPFNFSKKNVPLGSTSSSSNLHYNIEFINQINIEFIVNATTRMQYTTHNAAGILVLDIDPDSHFCSGCVEQAQNWFWNSVKIESPQKTNPGKLSHDAVVDNRLSIFFIRISSQKNESYQINLVETICTSSLIDDVLS